MGDVFRSQPTVAPLAPRELTPDIAADAANNGAFLRLFGTIWLIVGVGISLVFVTLALVVLRQLAFAVLIGAPFALAGAVLLSIGIIKRSRALMAYRDGVEVRGEVVDVFYQRSMRMNGRSPYRVTYAFTADGKPMRGVATFWSEPDVAVGASVVVLFNRDSPTNSVIWTHFDAKVLARRARIAVAAPTPEELGPEEEERDDARAKLRL